MRFELLQPQSIEEAVGLLSAHRDEAMLIAGGQSLLIMLRRGLVQPRLLLSLNDLSALSGLKLTPKGSLQIGALATHREILSSPLVRGRAALLAQAAETIGSTPVRNFGTIGGNLCHNEMGGDPPLALLALNAQAECMSVRGGRKIPLSEFFTGFFDTCLERDEILLGVEVPTPPPHSVGLYLKHTIRSGDMAIVGVAALLGICHEARLALGGVSPVPFRALEAERLLREQQLNDDLIEEAAKTAAVMSDPISDAHASAAYRRKMVRVFVRRAIHQAMKEAGNKKQ